MLKVSDSSSLDFSDQHDKIPLINSAKDFKKYLKRKNFVSSLKIKKVERDFFYKFDNKTYLRFWKIVNQLSKIWIIINFTPELFNKLQL